MDCELEYVQTAKGFNYVWNTRHVNRQFWTYSVRQANAGLELPNLPHPTNNAFQNNLYHFKHVPPIHHQNKTKQKHMKNPVNNHPFQSEYVQENIAMCQFIIHLYMYIFKLVETLT